jgi:hypothetical protein
MARPLRTPTITLGGRQINVPSRTPAEAQRLLDNLNVVTKPIQLRSGVAPQGDAKNTPPCFVSEGDLKSAMAKVDPKQGQGGDETASL